MNEYNFFQEYLSYARRALAVPGAVFGNHCLKITIILFWIKLNISRFHLNYHDY